MKRKGQIALEFIITYSWAIIIIVGIVAALLFMGLQDPTQYVTPSCLFEDSFSCEEFGFTLGDPVAGGGYVTIELKNLVGLPLEITGVDAIVDGTTECNFSIATAGNVIGSTSSFSQASPYTLSRGDSFYLELGCGLGQTLEDDSAVSIDIDLKYKIVGDGYFPKTTSGKVVGLT